MAEPFPFKFEIDRGETLEDRQFTFKNADGTPLQNAIAHVRLVVACSPAIDIEDTSTGDKLLVDNTAGTVTPSVDPDTTLAMVAGSYDAELWTEFVGSPPPIHPTHRGVVIVRDPIGRRP